MNAITENMYWTPMYNGRLTIVLPTPKNHASIQIRNNEDLDLLSDYFVIITSIIENKFMLIALQNSLQVMYNMYL